MQLIHNELSKYVELMDFNVIKTNIFGITSAYNYSRIFKYSFEFVSKILPTNCIYKETSKNFTQIDNHKVFENVNRWFNSSGEIFKFLFF